MENCGDASLSVPAVGRHFGFSGQYLSRVFREDQNMTIAACITEARMDRARGLLTQTDRPVEEVSEQCGFLSSLFKKVDGLTPGAYRRARGEIEASGNP
ncbi:MAG TPA: helix-turn-helix transcriptional regulator [Clostridia bacterium]|nr:helix-turn-helix transcriptional regulator [Clostridia bacterium]